MATKILTERRFLKIKKYDRYFWIEEAVMFVVGWWTFFNQKFQFYMFQVNSVDKQSLLNMLRKLSVNFGLLELSEGHATIIALLSLRHNNTDKDRHIIVFQNPIDGLVHIDLTSYLKNGI